MEWLVLLIGILLEVAGTTSMRLADGFSRVLPSVLVFVFYGLSLAAVTLALKHIHLSVVYAIWAGVGTALIVAIGAVWFKEPLGALKLISIAFVMLGVLGLHLDDIRR